MFVCVCMVFFELRQKALMTCSYGSSSSWVITPFMLWIDVTASSAAAGEWCTYILRSRSCSLHAQLSLGAVCWTCVCFVEKCTASNALLLLFNCWIKKCFMQILFFFFFTSPPACSAKCKAMITVFLWLFSVNLNRLFVCFLYCNNVPLLMFYVSYEE